MAKTSPRRPIDGRLRVELVRSTGILAKVLEDYCEDCLYKAQLYSHEDGEILMKSIVSDDDGSMFGVKFQMNSEEQILRVSNRFKTVGKRSFALNRIKEAIITYINTINDLGMPPVSAVFFDIGQRYNTVSYAPDPAEHGSIKIYLQAYNKDEFGISDMRSFASELAIVE